MKVNASKSIIRPNVRKHSQIGMMQGRLSPIRNGRIQSFPRDNWRDEIAEASELQIHKIEWTIDSEELLYNPLISSSGCIDINDNLFRCKVMVPSVTCDYFMENPPWRESEQIVLTNLKSIINGMREINSKILVIPLVDNSSIRENLYTSYVIDYFNGLEQYLTKSNVKIAFETDLPPDKFFSFIENFNSLTFGANYDIGNSASLGFNPIEEFEAIGKRILNVHVKDRILNGTTVPLGDGDADFELVFDLLVGSGYKGNYILQTARSSDGNHAASIVKYSNQVIGWLEERS
jgi:L-ribulose-5-phosphate 3-epimerase